MGMHPCHELNQAYKGYQGQNPDSAKFIFIGIDANFSADIEHSPIFKEILCYLTDGVRYWKDKKRHHPFLSPDYKKGVGYKYHLSFSKMDLTCKYADQISFIELLPFPTCDTKSSHFRGMFKNCLSENIAHLVQIDSWINSSENIKAILIPRGVYTKICELRKQSPGCFDWLPIEWKPPKAGKFIRNELYTSQARTNNNINVHVITHFSDAISDEHLKEIGMIIQS